MATLSSQTPLPGYEPASTGGLGTTVQLTNPSWQDAFVKFWADQWARNKKLPVGLDSGGWQYGQPSTDDYINANGEVVTSPLTILALSNYARVYQPGMDRETDLYLPYVAPAATDYVESPAERASRIQNEQLDKVAEASRNALTGSLGNTELGRLNAIGGLSLSMAQLGQNRADTIARLSADPGNWVERDFQVRGEATPPGQRIPLYPPNSNLNDALAGLKGFNPLQLNQGVGTPGGVPTSPTTSPAPRLPGQGTAGTPGGDIISGGTIPLTSAQRTQLSSQFPASQFEVNPNITYQDGSVWGTDPATGIFREISGPTGQITLANGTTLGPTSDLYKYFPAGTPMPAGSEAPAAAPSEASTPSPAPIAPQLSDAINPFNPTGVTPVDYTQMDPSLFGYASGGMTTDRQLIAGDPRVANRANPEIITNPTGAPLSITPMSRVAPQAMANASPNARFRRPMISMGIRGYADGTDPYTMSYGEDVYNRLPSLRYLRGETSPNQYNQLSTGYSSGAYDTQLPESGALNYRNVYDVLTDPVATSMMDALYRSASRNFGAEINRAKQRAPIGNAMSTSLIRT